MSYFTFNETFSFDLSSCRNRNKFNYFKANSNSAEGLFFPRLFCGSKKGFAERRARRIAVRQSDPNPPGVSANGWYGVVASIEACGTKPFLFSKKRKVYSQSKRENVNLDCALQRALGPGSTPGTGPQTNFCSELLHCHC